MNKNVGNDNLKQETLHILDEVHNLAKFVVENNNSKEGLERLIAIYFKVLGSITCKYDLDLENINILFNQFSEDISLPNKSNIFN